MRSILFTLTFTLCILSVSARAQSLTIKGKVFDTGSKEPLNGVTISESGSLNKAATDKSGGFILNVSSRTPDLLISFIGYETRTVTASVEHPLSIALVPKTEGLGTVVITANREAGLRTEAPVAISKINPEEINNTKASLLVELVNKVPGVVMLNYNNEQHGMGIRQPFGTSPYFLYLEDGIPLRPLGVFNHNALIETNIFALSNIEVIKGPASSLYGAEAVGGTINFITQKPTVVPTAKVGLQADNYGYKRVQWGAGGYLSKKLGIYAGGFVAGQTDSWQTRSDYNKFSLNLRGDYHLSGKSDLTGTLALHNYYSQTGGSVDSLAYYSRKYVSNNNFTYRSVDALRASVKLTRNWNSGSRTELTAYYRSNSIGQNPSYSIRWTPGAASASGEINENSFKSLGLVAQHSRRFDWLNSNLLIGTSVDRSPNSNYAYKTELSAELRPDKKSVEKYTMIRELPDELLTNYQAVIFNSAVFGQFDFHPAPFLKASLGGRYDRMAFNYNNFLDQTSGSKAYGQFTPKVGLTADLGHDMGIYFNLSKGFSPPGLSAIFRKNTAATSADDLFYYGLKPAIFSNIELGGWAALLQNKIYVDWAIYKMNGRNELLNIRQPDGSTDYQSAGKTVHKGIEYSISYKPNSTWSIRFGGTNAIHRFTEFTLSNREADNVKNVNGYDMPQAPKWVGNTEITYKPAYVKGLRLGLEWQAISSWYQNQINSVKYNDKGALGFQGISVLNFRTGYQFRSLELFVNVLNFSNELYASAATRGNNISDRSTYTPSAPRTFITGIQYNFNGKK
ncbi:TonB-dependent receptor [Flavihumibacter sp. R14]|nr:TonB-dependent receptor [Flavihumibacter soli]